MALIVQGNRFTGRHREHSAVQYGVFELDPATNSKGVTLIESDDRGETGPRKTPVSHLGGGVSERSEPRKKAKGIYALDGDTLKVAVAIGPNDSPTPTEFVAKKSEPWGGVMVVHLARMKEPPAWVSEPPPAKPATTGTTAYRRPAPLPTSAPKGK